MTATPSTSLLIARHGNTFGPDETPRRVGARTDLPLVKSGQTQARNLARYIQDKELLPDLILTSQLQRTIEMAEIIQEELNRDIETHPLAIFNEIDYGPDENKVEEDVIARLGKDAIKKWDDDAVVPDGWLVDPEEIKTNWINFANGLQAGTRTLVITSNGIARFAPHITGDFETFRKNHALKIATGALCILDKNATKWSIRGWNIRP